MNTAKNAIKAGVWYIFSNFLTKGIAFVTMGIFARLLTKTEFGLYNNYTSCLMIATVVVTLNLEATLVSARFDYRNNLDEYLLSILVLSGLSVCTWGILINCFHGFVSGILSIDWHYLNIMLLYLFFTPVILITQAKSRFQFDYCTNIAISLTITIGTVVLSIVLIGVMKDKLLALILGNAIPTILLGIAFYMLYINNGRRINIDCWRYALPICIPYIPHLLSMTALNAMDKIMITRYCGAEPNAVYSLAYTCGSIITLLGMSINSAYSPWLGNKLEENSEDSKKEIKSFSVKYIGVFFAISLGIMLIAPEVLFVLGGAKYADSKYVMAPIAVGCMFQFLYTMFVNVEQYKKKTLGMAFASVSAALVNFILNYIFIPKYGYLAAAYTTLAGYLCLLLLHMYLVKRIGLKSIYNYNYVLLVCLFGIGAMVIMTLLYRANLPRYFFLSVYVLVVLRYLWNNRITVHKLILYVLK